MPDRTDAGRPMLRLRELTKRYRGQDRPAVDRLSLDVAAGELMVFVGPSGCGKTTTLKMINRLVEPTSGSIELDGEDVTHVDPNRLRRRIGYVIQQTGLLPHLTVGANVALVPRLLGWPSARVRARVDEMLELVGLDPAEHRDRYPRELSGGQQQRVGVARALAGDPPVLLMDEPFGATDPLTRERLQNELLRVQAEVRKTIVLVTHDIDEAIKLGDRIAVFGERSRLAQVGTPDEVLGRPADPYVKRFVGAGASLKRLHLVRLDAVPARPFPTARVTDDPALVRDLVVRSRSGSVLLLDAAERPVAWVAADDLTPLPADLAGVGLPATATLTAEATLHDALDVMLGTDGAGVILVDGDGRFRGVVGLDEVMAHVARLHAESRRHDVAAAAALGSAEGAA
ncbi:MAG: ATP-binding cassette domain-containing protein [Thermoanaerobacterales bacterium]|nr:ATP-binding cassette domain-containing protein [Thermoanaerobacterales bacterium]